MNYKELYNEYQVLEKEMRDRINEIQKLHKMTAKEMENGDSKSFRRDVTFLESAVTEEARVLNAMKELKAGFNPREYFGGGEFVAQMLEAYGKLGADVKGELPVYEMFPYRAKIDAGNQDFYLDWKEVQRMRPRSSVRQVRVGQDKLMRASFDALISANELADVYDLAFPRSKRQPEADIYLISPYRFLVPMERSRRNYDQQSYAFDSARLYSPGIKEIKDGRRT